MKTPVLIIILLITLSFWGVPSVKASMSCPDTSYFEIDVHLSSSDCAKLNGCVYIQIRWSTGTLIRQTQYISGKNDYSFCVPGPISYNIVPFLWVDPNCQSGTTMDQTDYGTPYGPPWPIYASSKTQPVTITIDPYCWH